MFFSEGLKQKCTFSSFISTSWRSSSEPIILKTTFIILLLVIHPINFIGMFRSSAAVGRWSKCHKITLIRSFYEIALWKQYTEAISYAFAHTSYKRLRKCDMSHYRYAVNGLMPSKSIGVVPSLVSGMQLYKLSILYQYAETYFSDRVCKTFQTLPFLDLKHNYV